MLVGPLKRNKGLPPPEELLVFIPKRISFSSRPTLQSFWASSASSGVVFKPGREEFRLWVKWLEVAKEEIIRGLFGAPYCANCAVFFCPFGRGGIRRG